MESSTYGSEFMAARIAVEQIIDMRYTLRMMGVPLDGPLWLFGDNESVIVSSTIPTSTLKKRHNSISYHLCCETIALSIVNFIHLSGEENPADVLTKHLESWKHIPLMKPILSAYYETSDDPTQGEGSVETEALGVHPVLKRIPRTPIMTPKVKIPQK